jgi:hypothetical protein
MPSFLNVVYGITLTAAPPSTNILVNGFPLVGMKAGTGKSRTDRHCIPRKPTMTRFSRKSRKIGKKNTGIRRLQEQEQLGLFPDRIHGSRI